MAQQATVRSLTGLIHDLTDAEVMVLTESANRPALKRFLASHEVWQDTTYDQSVGLIALIARAVGPDNLDNIKPDITKHLKIAGTGIRTVDLRVAPYLDNETGEQIAERLTAAGHILANVGDLAGFLHDHPDQVKQWSWVYAISEDSRWTYSGGCVYAPAARVDGACRHFNHEWLRTPLNSRCGVLVSRESGT